MNVAADFVLWKKSFFATEKLVEFEKITANLKLISFAHNLITKTITWSISNHHPLNYDDAQKVDIAFKDGIIKKVYWNYENLIFDEKTLGILPSYLTNFAKIENLKVATPEFVLSSSTNQLILISPRFKIFSLYEKDIRIFMENWGISLPKLFYQAKKNIIVDSVPVFQPVSKPKESTILLNQVVIPVKKPILPSTSTNTVIKNPYSLQPKFVPNKKFILNGEVLKITTQSFDHKHFVNILIDTGKKPYLLMMYPKEIKFDSIPKKGHWYHFDCEFFLKKTRFNTSTPVESIKCSDFHAIDQFFDRFDDASKKRIELHTHTKMSALDGIGVIKDYLKLAKNFGHSAIAFTDHENIHAFSELEQEINNFPQLKIIFGCEFNILSKKNMVMNNFSNQTFSEAEFAVLDVETTGLSVKFEEMIEFAVVILKKGFPIKEENFLIKSEIPIAQSITELTNITSEEQQKHGINPKLAAQKIHELIQNRIIVAHNADFDIGFINKLLTTHGYDSLKNIVIDTIPLGRCLFPDKKSFRLGRLARYLGVFYNPIKAHRALYDTRVLSKIFTNLVLELKIQNFDQLFAFNNERKSRASIIPKHANVLVKNNVGLFNLYKLISITHTKTLYRQPTLEWKDFREHSTGLLIGSGCYNGEVFQAAAFGTKEALKKAISFYDYIEIQPPEVYQHLVDREFLTIFEIQEIIKQIIKSAQEQKKIVVATGDVHFVHPEDVKYRNIYIFNKQLKGRRHPLFDFKGRIKSSPPQFFRTTNEMKTAFSFLNDEHLIEQIVVDNTHLIADQIEKLHCFSSSISMPVLENAADRLTKMAKLKLNKKYGQKIDSIIQKRFDHELGKVIRQGYATIYLIAEHLTTYSMNQGYLVGSRGSVGSSFLAYCLDITEVNPLPPHYYCFSCSVVEWVEKPSTFSGFDLLEKHCHQCRQPFRHDGQTIAFESFLGLDELSLPDIDLNFSGNFQNKAQKYLSDWLTKILGPNKVFRAGTISAVAEKTAYGYWHNYQEEYKLPIPSSAELEKILCKISGVKRTTGQHPGGLMIIPKDIDVHNFTPYHYPSNNSEEEMTTHFDYHALHNRLLKIDLLGHDDPTGLRMLQELTGKDPKTIPLAEPAVINIFSDINALGIKPSQVNKEKTGSIGLPEFGTDFVRRICRDFRVSSFADLISVSGLSHGTNVWENNARDLLVKNKNFKFQDVIANRDDIMNFLISYKLSKEIAYNTMQKIKKGKGLTNQEEKDLLNFGVPKWFIESCQKIKYLFPKAHATAYSIMAYRFAWYKLTYPTEFYATYFSIRCEVFDLVTITEGPAAINSKISEINSMIRREPQKVTVKDKNLLPIYHVALEMYARKIILRPLSLFYSHADKFIVRTEENQKVIYPSFHVVERLGKETAQQIVNECQKSHFINQEDFRIRTGVNKAIFDNLELTGLFKKLPKSFQKEFFS